MKGKVIWLTGLSAAGKSSIAQKMKHILDEKKLPSLLLDGDEVREAIGDFNCGHDPESRLLNAYRISRFAKMISEQGCIVIVATMSLYHEIHNWNRKNFPNYFEVFIKADLDILKQRDPKGLYKNFSAGNTNNIPGMDLDPEFPLNPDLVIENNGQLNEVKKLANEIISKCNFL